MTAHTKAETRARHFTADSATGLPVLHTTVCEEALAELGITKKRATSCISLKDLDSGNLSEDQRGQLRFAPTAEVVRLEGSNDLWFRMNAKNWATVFTILPGNLVVLTAEYKHGADIISVVSPSGVPKKGESMADCGKREFEEETGIVLAGVLPLSTSEGLALSSRKSTERVFPFVGYPATDSGGTLIIGNQKLDKNENLKVFLMPLIEYWSWISSSHYDNEAATRDAAYAALRELGYFQLYLPGNVAKRP